MRTMVFLFVLVLFWDDSQKSVAGPQEKKQDKCDTVNGGEEARLVSMMKDEGQQQENNTLKYKKIGVGW